jgi:3-isopropylmalate/(R)-2-methylmalate dehydratase small subunit
MNKNLATGRVRKLGDDINTDYIVPSHRKKETIDPDVLKQFLFEDIHPGFHDAMAPETVLVGGHNFGCGSAMEIAVTVLQAAGVRAVIARSFSRTFRRNALNNGLLICQAALPDVSEDEQVNIHLQQGDQLILTLGDGPQVAAGVLPAFMGRMLEAGGLVPFLREQGGFNAETRHDAD